jgi:glycosyltransferase involved in cell wall biosynthesis
LILRAADIHVSASHTEGFPNNVLEAMCASLPVVAASVGGIPEMVVDGQTGLLVPARDPEGMAGALLALAHDPGRRKAMGEAGRNLVASSFSLGRSVSAIENVYSESATPRPPL